MVQWFKQDALRLRGQIKWPLALLISNFPGISSEADVHSPSPQNRTEPDRQATLLSCKLKMAE